jgi:uncharacterized membrane protein YdbT with pleckstrin-like domain
VAAVPYPKNLLNDYETVALDLHPHWWHFAEPAITLAITIIIGIVLLAVGAPDWLNLVMVVAIVLGAVWLLVRFVQWRTTNFVITSDRVIFRHGVIAKSGIEIPLERVNSVHFNQSIFERMIGAGDLLIESGADYGQQRFTDIKDPDHVQLLIHQQMEVNEDRMHRGQPARPDVLGAQLERLEGLRDRGTLTPEEFEAQKRRLLGG